MSKSVPYAWMPLLMPGLCVCVWLLISYYCFKVRCLFSVAWRQCRQQSKFTLHIYVFFIEVRAGRGKRVPNGAYYRAYMELAWFTGLVFILFEAVTRTCTRLYLVLHAQTALSNTMIRVRDCITTLQASFDIRQVNKASVVLLTSIIVIIVIDIYHMLFCS